MKLKIGPWRNLLQNKRIRASSAILVVLTGLLSVCVGQAGHVSSAPGSAVAARKTVWVDASQDGSPNNIRVDVGNLRQIADEIEAQFSRRLTGNALRTAQREYAKISVPEGSLELDTERVVCSEEGLIAFPAKIKILSPEGAVVYTKEFDSNRERRRQETSKLHAEYPFNYGRTPASLVCWAAARKCEGKDLSWPPPEQTKPSSTEALRDFSRLFVPSCRI
jgi:hypothetical protein